MNAQVLAQLSHQLCGRQRIEPHLHERSLEVHGFVCVAVEQRLDAFNDLRSDQGLDLLEALTCVLRVLAWVAPRASRARVGASGVGRLTLRG